MGLLHGRLDVRRWQSEVDPITGLAIPHSWVLPIIHGRGPGAHRYKQDLWNSFRALSMLTHMTCCKGLISLLHHADLSFITGGSKAKFRYADDPSKVWVLRPSGPSRSTHSEALGNDHPWVSSVWEEDLLPRLRDPRTWQGCLLTDIDGEVSHWKSMFVSLKISLFSQKKWPLEIELYRVSFY